MTHLDTDQAAWQRILSAIATSESMEHHVLAPLILVYQPNREDTLVLYRHSADERRHAELLLRYLRETFSYIKRKPTNSDRIFYYVLLPSLRFFVKKNPLVGFSLLYFYELFSVQLYANLRKKAKIENLSTLESLLLEIEKDEYRHIDSMRNFILRFPIGNTDRILIYILVSIFRLDIHMGKLAIHNRMLRKYFLHLGIHPDLVVNKCSAKARKQCIELLRKSMQ